MNTKSPRCRRCSHPVMFCEGVSLAASEIWVCPMCGEICLRGKTGEERITVDEDIQRLANELDTKLGEIQAALKSQGLPDPTAKLKMVLGMLRMAGRDLNRDLVVFDYCPAAKKLRQAACETLRVQALDESMKDLFLGTDVEVDKGDQNDFPSDDEDRNDDPEG